MSFAEWISKSPTQHRDGANIAVVVAHQDDESIGCGGLLMLLRGVNVVMITDGAPRRSFSALRAGYETVEDLAAARARELRNALGVAGVGEDQIREFGVPDGDVWVSLVGIVQRLAAFFDERCIDAVLLHAFEGGHSDHDGVAYAVHMAAAMLGPRAPQLIEMPLYHLGARDMTFQTFCDGDPGLVTGLSESQSVAKKAMFAAHVSQSRVLERFTTHVERFRVAMCYDFRKPPNGGRVSYLGAESTIPGLPNWPHGGQTPRLALAGAHPPLKLAGGPM